MRGNLQRVAAEIIKNKKSIPEKEVMRAVLEFAVAVAGM